MAGRAELEKAAELYARLRAMLCPGLDGVYVTEPQSIHDLLCAPSVHRLDILEWICTRVCPPLQEQFFTLKESQADVKVKVMAKLGFDLMLCNAEDVDLIKGEASPRRQLAFMDQLLDIIQTFEDPSELQPATPGGDRNPHACARQSEELLKELFSSRHFQATLTPECNPWPADLKTLLVPEELQKRTPPCSKDNVISDHIQELQKLALSLEDIKQECTFLCSADPGEDAVVQKLTSALSDFHQLLASFTQVYENEFAGHCGRPAHPISPSGPLFHHAHQLLTKCCQELEAIAQFTTTSSAIEKVLNYLEGAKEYWARGAMTTMGEKIEELKRNYDFL